jgi:hypothetical protein
MSSRFLNRRKLNLSRRKYYGGAEGEESKVAPGSAESESEKLRKAASDALLALQKLPKFDLSNQIAKGDGSVVDESSLFYQRCQKSQDLVNGMQENLQKEVQVHLENLKKAEVEMLDKRKAAVKAKAAFQFLLTKLERFKEQTAKLEVKKDEIHKLVDAANELNEQCTTDLEETTTKSMKDLIADQIKELEAASLKTQNELTDLLKLEIEKKDDSTKPAASKDGESSDSEKAFDESRAQQAANADKGGRYRRSRSNNLRKRRSYNKFY